MEDRRRFQRATIKLPVTVMLDRRPVPGDLVDISGGGLLFTCRAAVEISDLVEVEIRVTPDRTCSGQGTVVRASNDRGFGVEFSDCNPAMKEFVGDLLQLRAELQGDFLANVVNPMVFVRSAVRAQG